MTLPLGATFVSWLLLPSSIAAFFSPIQSPMDVPHRRRSTARCRNEPRSILPHVSPVELRSSASTNDVTQTAPVLENKTTKTTTEGTTTTTTTTTATPTQSRETKWEMPWTEIQQYALQDNLPKYTVMIRSTTTSSPRAAPPKPHAMWRTMTREIPELAGYPIPFLMAMHQQTKTNAEPTPALLPMVDDYEFASNGGIVGRAYGLAGIADGTRIYTPPLMGVEKTLPLGYVTTASTHDDDDDDDDFDQKVGFSYELGTCASSSVYSLDGSERSAALLSARRLMMMDGMETAAADMSGTVGQRQRRLVTVAKDAVVTGSGLLTDAEANRDLAYLGGATAMLLASAAAVGMLSHHLTVNVFWV